MKRVNKNVTPQVLPKRSISDRKPETLPEPALKDNPEVRVEAVEEVATIPCNLQENQHKSIALGTTNGARVCNERLKNTDGVRLRNSIVPDVFVSNDEGFAKRLGGVEPDSGVLLGCGGRLTRDGA